MAPAPAPPSLVAIRWISSQIQMYDKNTKHQSSPSHFLSESGKKRYNEEYFWSEFTQLNLITYQEKVLHKKNFEGIFKCNFVDGTWCFVQEFFSILQVERITAASSLRNQLKPSLTNVIVWTSSGRLYSYVSCTTAIINQKMRKYDAKFVRMNIFYSERRKWLLKNNRGEKNDAVLLPTILEQCPQNFFTVFALCSFFFPIWTVAGKMKENSTILCAHFLVTVISVFIFSFPLFPLHSLGFPHKVVNEMISYFDSQKLLVYSQNPWIINVLGWSSCFFTEQMKYAVYRHTHICCYAVIAAWRNEK